MIYITIYIAKDGRKIPMSLVYHKQLEKQFSISELTQSLSSTSTSTSSLMEGKGSIPTILYGYGSYGASIDPTFDYKRIPLLDRGMVYCIG